MNHTLPRSTSNKKDKKKKALPKTTFSSFPKHLEKENHLYLDGVIDSTNRSFHFCTSDDGMSFICTATKLDKLRIKVLPGDRVVIEVPLLALEPNAARQKGRLVFRYKKQN